MSLGRIRFKGGAFANNADGMLWGVLDHNELVIVIDDNHASMVTVLSRMGIVMINTRAVERL